MKKYFFFPAIVCLIVTIAICVYPKIPIIALIFVPLGLVLIFAMSFCVPIEIKRTDVKKPFAKYLYWCLFIAGCALISSIFIDVFYSLDLKLETNESIGVFAIAFIVYVLPLTLISALAVLLSALWLYIKKKQKKETGDKQTSFGHITLIQAIVFAICISLLSLLCMMFAFLGNENIFIVELLFIPVPPVLCILYGYYSVKKEYLFYSCLTYSGFNLLTFILYALIVYGINNIEQMDSIMNFKSSIHSIIILIGQIVAFCIVTIIQFLFLKRKSITCPREQI